MSGIFSGIDSLFDGDRKRRPPGDASRVRGFAPEFATLGWDERKDDSAQTKQLRTSLLGSLSELDDAQVIAEARRRFAGFQTDPATLSPELRSTVLRIVARHADAATWDALHAMAKKETSSMLRDQFYALLAEGKARRWRNAPSNWRSPTNPAPPPAPA
ncbi:ERAP1-like C-terminal domain-containing protein [Xanthomonas oryzae]|uniref:ERAP1-like C-terminal domain-containing protein n=1 Tax=Xanthomonas oryzae TaxID=347 RepID=UPI001FD6DA77|nr:ERAP1-like C-terminal domain-containing protein [Xanthomonas oryzae]